MYIYIYIYIHAHIYTHIHTHAHTYTHIYIYIFIYIYIYIYKWVFGKKEFRFLLKSDWTIIFLEIKWNHWLVKSWWFKQQLTQILENEKRHLTKTRFQFWIILTWKYEKIKKIKSIYIYIYIYICSYTAQKSYGLIDW